MDYLEEIFRLFEEDKEPDTPEYRENRAIRAKLMGQVTAAMGEDMEEKVRDVFSEHEALECERFFRQGLRLGLELVRLL